MAQKQKRSLKPSQIEKNIVVITSLLGAIFLSFGIYLVTERKINNELKEFDDFTSSTKYIYSVKDLNAIKSKDMNDTYILMEDLTIENGLSTYSANSSLTGTFDGNGHTITFNCMPKNPLFYRIDKNGTVKNLGLKFNISFTPETKNFAGICEINEGTIMDSFAYYESLGVLDNNYIGGLVCYNQGIIERCVSSVSFQENSNYISSYRIGGIAGVNRDGGKITKSFSVVSSYYLDNLNFENHSEEFIPYIGSIVGYQSSNSTLLNVYTNTNDAPFSDRNEVIQYDLTYLLTSDFLFSTKTVNFSSTKWHIVEGELPQLNEQIKSEGIL